MELKTSEILTFILVEVYYGVSKGCFAGFARKDNEIKIDRPRTLFRPRKSVFFDYCFDIFEVYNQVYRVENHENMNVSIIR